MGVQGAEPLGGGQGAKLPEANAFLGVKIVIKAITEYMHFFVKLEDRKANFITFDA